MVFSWSPIWGTPGLTDKFEVMLNKFPIAVIPKNLHAVYLDALLWVIVEVSEPEVSPS